MNRTALTALAVATAVGGLTGVADAKHKKPITKSYTANAPMPDPTNWADPVKKYSVCNQMVPNSFHVEEFAAPEPGTLKVTMGGYQGDWDLLVVDDKGREMGNAGAADLGVDEKATVKLKKAGTVNIIACNWVGGPTAAVKYEFTFAK